MALGYELTGTGPRLIANAGSAMAESIRQTGEKIRGDIIQHNTDRQVVGLLNDAKLLNIKSPTFQNDLIGVLGKYPMALGDERTKIGITLLGQAWKQEKEEQDALMEFNRKKTIFGLQHPNAGKLYGDGIRPPLPFNDPLQEPKIPDPAMEFGAGQGGGVFGRFGVGLGNGMSFGSGMGDMGGVGFTPQADTAAPEEEPSILPDLPPALGGGQAETNPVLNFRNSMKGRIPAEVGQREEARLAAAYEREKMKRQTAAIKPVYRSGTNDIVMKQPDGSMKVVFKASPKAKSVYVTEDGEPYQQLTDGKWIFPDGQIHNEGPEVGIKRVPGFTEERRLENQEGAATLKQENAELTRALKSLNSKRDVIVKDRAAKLKTIESFEKEGKAVPQQNYDALRALDEQLKIHDDLIAELGSEKTVDKAATRIIERNGKKYEVDDATKKVLREVQ